MPKKVKLNLTYSANQLWWSADDGINWGVVGPKSPVTILDKDADVDWIADDTLDLVSIDLDNDSIMDGVTGTSKDKKGKVKSSSQNGDKCKYSIKFTVTGGGTGVISVDPEMKICAPPCPPGL